jgi:signal transduction histidine kinase
VAFDEELRSYLESLERAAQEVPVRRRHVDGAALRQHFLDRLRELERSQEVVRKLFDQWSPRIEELARYVENLPLQDAPIEEAAALAFARSALDHGMNIGDTGMGLVDELEVARAVEAFGQLGALEPYALENRLIRRGPSEQLEVTALGRVFLRLRGKDAVQWLLTVEVAQSQGHRDPWRTSRDLLLQALSAGGITADRYDQDGAPHFPFDFDTLQRLERLGVLRSGINQRNDIYGQVTSSMRRVVQEVLEDGLWHSAVAALLEDERANVLPVLGSRATDAAIEQTRMIAHEVRNALIPVRHHVDALLKSASEASRARLESSRRGVVRVLAFVDEMIATSELLDEPLTSFEVGDVVRDALGWIDGGERVELDLPADPIRIRARRSRLQRAVLNVLLNAIQATSTGQRVRAQARSVEGMVEVIVDDGGPGVPEESRTIVFQDGFTTRGGAGGSGFGLAYVRRVVEDLNGRVWCETSELGGARFVMALPEGEAEK